MMAHVEASPPGGVANVGAVWRPDIDALAFQLDEDRHLVVDEIEDLFEGRDPFAAAIEFQRGQFTRASLGERAALRGQAVQFIVVKDDGLAVGGNMHVEFDRIARADCGRERAQRILDALPPVQPAMRDRHFAEPGQAFQIMQSRRSHRPRPRH